MTVDRSPRGAMAVPVALFGIGGRMDASSRAVLSTFVDAEQEPALLLGLGLERLATADQMYFAAVSTVQTWAHLIAVIERQADELGYGAVLRAALDQEREHVKRLDWSES